MIGHLTNEVVYIYRASETEDNSGSIVTTFTLQSTESARVQPVSGKEIIRAGGVQGDIWYNFYLDNDADILSTDRIEYNSSTYEILERMVYHSTYIKVVGRLVI